MTPAFAFRFPLAGGLHARPASALRAWALAREASLQFHNDRSGLGASLANLLDLLATDTRCGDPCRITAGGQDPDTALEGLEAFLGGPFLASDGVPAPAGEARLGAALGRILAGAAVAQGIPVAPGAGWGPAVLAKPERPGPERFPFPSQDPRQEAEALRAALARAAGALRRQAAQALDLAKRGILEAQAAMVQDASWVSGMEADLQAGHRAPAAVLRAVEAGRARLEAAPNPLLHARALDLEDLGDRLLADLTGTAPEALVLEEPGVLVAARLTPSRLLGLDQSLLRGLVLAEGAAGSHTVILARSFGIPCVVCADAPRVRAGQPVLVDGDRGVVVPDPPQALLDYYGIQARERARRGAPEGGATADGTRVSLLANILMPQEARAAFEAGAEGIGLFRTEMLFLDRPAPPTEDEQYEACRQVLEAAAGRPVVMRLLDVGGDKPLPYLPLPPEANPFLGVRGVRWYARHPELVATQLRAAARAAVHGDLRLLVPMVSDLEEIRQVRALAREAGAGSLPLGIMVEVPAAALNLAALAREADFLSVGSNDLVQYLFAADRGEEAVSRPWHAWHPATLRMLAGILEAAAAAGRPVSLCGELAGQAELLPLLVGLGLRNLSMAPGLLGPARRALAALDAGRCRERAALALEAGTAGAVREILQEAVEARALDLVDPDLVVLDAACASKEAALKLLAERLAALGRARDPLALEDALWDREGACSTSVGHGFAVPHCKSPAVAAPSLAFLRLPGAVPWGGQDGESVDCLILLATGEDGGEGHLRIFARLARRLMDPGFRQALRGAAEPGTVLALIQAEVLTIS